MSVFDDVRRWAKDKWTEDEMIVGPPPEKMRELSESLPQLSARERLAQLEHVKAYATYYYEGHQRERVPPEVRQELAQMEKQAARLNSVDQAREVLQRYGGPPTRDTIYESLERSQKEREQVRESIRPQAESESIQEKQSVGYRMKV